MGDRDIGVRIGVGDHVCEQLADRDVGLVGGQQPRHKSHGKRDQTVPLEVRNIDADVVEHRLQTAVQRRALNEALRTLARHFTGLLVAGGERDLQHLPQLLNGVRAIQAAIALHG